MPIIKIINEKIKIDNNKYNLIRKKGESINEYYLKAQKSSTEPEIIGIKKCIRELAQRDDKEQLMNILDSIEKDLCKQLHKRNQLTQTGFSPNLYKVNNTNLYAYNQFYVNKTEDWSFLDKAYYDIKVANSQTFDVNSNEVHQFSNKNAKLLEDGYIDHPSNLLDLYIQLDIVNRNETEILKFISKAKEQDACNAEFYREDFIIKSIFDKINQSQDLKGSQVSLNVENLNLSRNEAKIKHSSVVPYNDFKQPSTSKDAENRRYL